MKYAIRVLTADLDEWMRRLSLYEVDGSSSQVDFAMMRISELQKAIDRLTIEILDISL